MCLLFNLSFNIGDPLASQQHLCFLGAGSQHKVPWLLQRFQRSVMGSTIKQEASLLLCGWLHGSTYSKVVIIRLQYQRPGMGHVYVRSAREDDCWRFVRSLAYWVSSWRLVPLMVLHTSVCQSHNHLQAGLCSQHSAGDEELRCSCAIDGPARFPRAQHDAVCVHLSLTLFWRFSLARPLLERCRMMVEVSCSGESLLCYWYVSKMISFTDGVFHG